MAVKVTIKIPDGYSYASKQEIAARIVDYIKVRTLSGVDKNDNPFAPYTLEYAKEKGVGINDVDLESSGRMLDSMKIFKITKNEIEIGFDGRSKEALKAEGQILGTYGQPVSNPAKVRDFLGIDDEDLESILKEFELSDEEKMAAARENAAGDIASIMDDKTINKWMKEQLLEELGMASPPSWMED